LGIKRQRTRNTVDSKGYGGARIMEVPIKLFEIFAVKRDFRIMQGSRMMESLLLTQYN